MYKEKGIEKLQLYILINLKKRVILLNFSFVGIKQDGSAEKIDTIEQAYGTNPTKNVHSVNRDGSKIEEKKENVEIIAGAGEKIGKLARVFLKRDISGFEELSGIPGTLGGAVRMNAGAHGKEMKDIIKGVKCIDYNGKEKILTTEEMQFDYRKSMLVNNKYIVTKVKNRITKR